MFHPISVGGKVVGAIGVIGPNRMDYKKVIASLNYFADGLTGNMAAEIDLKKELLLGDPNDGKGNE